MLAELDDLHALLRANPLWYGPRGNVREAMVAFTTFREAIRGWRSGNFDIGLAPSDLDETARLFTARGLGTDYIAYRVTDPPLSDVRVRRALARALDRDALRFPDLKLRGESGGLIPPPLPAHSHDLALAFDPDRARRLLAEAGFPGGRGLRPLRLLSATGWGTDVPEWAIEQWAELGVSVQLEVLPGDAHDASLADPNRPVDIWRNGWVADYPDPEGFLDTLLAANPAIHRDEALMALLRKARSSRDQEERWQLYREADRRLVRELVSIVPLAHLDNSVGARRWVEGVRLDSFRALPLLDQLNVRR